MKLRILMLSIACLLVAPFLLVTPTSAQSTPPQTPHIGLYLPAHGSLSWDTWLNANANVLDSDIFAIQTVTNYHTDGTKHLVTTGTPTGGSDTALQVTIPSGSSSATYTFATPYTTAPVCVASPQGNFISVPWKVFSGTTSVIISLQSGIGSSALFSVICMGFPN